jgi:antitoxin (DNA-binding transcriptional repressor) of toxin-antitoxin stability system
MQAMSEIISMHAAKSTLSQLVKRAVAGEAVYIGAYGRAEVQLVPVTATSRPRRQLGLLKGKLVLPADLDAPLPEKVLRSFEGEA